MSTNGEFLQQKMIDDSLYWKAVTHSSLFTLPRRHRRGSLLPPSLVLLVVPNNDASLAIDAAAD